RTTSYSTGVHYTLKLRELKSHVNVCQMVDFPFVLCYNYVRRTEYRFTGVSQIQTKIRRYIMRFTGFVVVCFSIVMLVSLLGCASMGGGQISGINWALAKNGGKVTAFSEDEGHPTSALINGISSSEGWNEGEGWQAPMNVAGTRRRGAGRSEEERSWVMVELAQPATVSNVKIYTIDSEEFPARDFGVSSLLIQCEVESALKEKLWVSAERFGKGMGEQDNVIKNNASGVIDVRFEPVRTQRVRLLIYRTNDLERSESDSKSLSGVIRLTEIEVYGTAKHKSRDEMENIFGN
ncbi:hypothetical protein ACFL6S_30835, partial [Candidatus Poribacteria bacterium]